MPKLDKYDLEAEKEGNAIKRGAWTKPRIIGKRLAKMRRDFASGNQKHQTKVEKRYVN